MLKYFRQEQFFLQNFLYLKYDFSSQFWRPRFTRFNDMRYWDSGLTWNDTRGLNCWWLSCYHTKLSQQIAGSGFEFRHFRTRETKMTHKNTKKVKKFNVLKCCMFSLKDWGLFLELGRPSWRCRDKLEYLKKKFWFFSDVKLFKIWSPKPWLRIRNWIRIRTDLKCWIRNLIQTTTQLKKKQKIGNIPKRWPPDTLLCAKKTKKRFIGGSPTPAAMTPRQMEEVQRGLRRVSRTSNASPVRSGRLDRTKPKNKRSSISDFILSLL